MERRKIFKMMAGAGALVMSPFVRTPENLVAKGENEKEKNFRGTQTTTLQTLYREGEKKKEEDDVIMLRLPGRFAAELWVGASLIYGQMNPNRKPKHYLVEAYWHEKNSDVIVVLARAQEE